MKILIADDSSLDRKLMRYTMEKHGCQEVIEAGDGCEGLELAKSERPDLIISDAMMPRMDGFQFLRSIKSDATLRSIPFIFYTAVYTGDEGEDLALSLGAEAFLVKPQEPDDIWDAVTSALAGREIGRKKSFEAERVEEKEEFISKYGEVITLKLQEKIHELENTLRQREKAEDALRESEARYRCLLESVTDYIYTVTVNDGLPVASSHGAGCTAVTGYTPEELTGDTMLWYRMVYEEDRKAVLEQATRMLSGVVMPLEHRIIHKNGGIRWVRNTPVLRGDPQGGAFAYDGLISDITVRKELENRLNHAQKMEALGTLVGGIAHDFNNILMVIIGYVKLLQKRITNDEQTGHYIAETLVAADRAVNLTRSLLAFGRKQEIAARAVNLNDIVRSVEKMLQRLLRENIELKVLLSGEELVIMGDQTQIEQVLINLAINSQDAMHSGGTITISTESVEIDQPLGNVSSFPEPGKYALLVFTDNGAGMDDQTRRRIFEPFFTTKETGKGTGLGLSVCHGIIMQHNGYIDCRSAPGSGTTFRIHLPMITAEPERKQLASASPPPRGTELILLAEDDHQTRSLFRELLINHGYKVIESEDGEDAVAKFKSHEKQIGLVIIDGIMPKLNGREAYLEIERANPDVKAIFISGYTGDFYDKDKTDNGRIQFLPKPVMPNELLQCIRDMLDENAPSPKA